jgi:hypothetical protein
MPFDLYANGEKNYCPLSRNEHYPAVFGLKIVIQKVPLLGWVFLGETFNYSHDLKWGEEMVFRLY